MAQPSVLVGVSAIASALGMPRRRVERLIALRAVPTFRLHDGGRVHCADREALAEWLAQRAATARRSA